MPRPRQLRLAATALAVAAALLILGGCGSSGTSVRLLASPVAQAATVSNNVAGMKMNFVLRLTAPILPAPIVGTGSGTFDNLSRSGSLKLTMNLGAIPQVTQILGTSTLQIQEILSGLTFYLKLPGALARSPSLHGKPWLKVNLANAARAAGIPGLSSLISNPTSSDPSQFLRYLRATSGGVTKVGTATVDGFQTTEYRAQINLDRVPSTFPAAARAQVRQAVGALEQTAHLHMMPIKVWIDGQHLVRRMQVSLGESVSGQALTAGLQIDIPQYGPQPAPQLPPPSQVADLTGSIAGR